MKKYQDKYLIRSFDVDMHKKLLPTRLCQYFQESAGNDAENRGHSYFDMLQNNQVWVLSRLKIEMDEMPAWGDQIVMQTWAKEMKGISAYRDFEILDPKNHVCIRGASLFSLINIESRRPVRLDDLAKKWAPFIAFNSGCSAPAKIEELGQVNISIERTVKYSDIDVNGHCNNAKYLEWILDIIPEYVTG